MIESAVLMFIVRYAIVPLFAGLAALAVFEWVWDRVEDWRESR